MSTEFDCSSMYFLAALKFAVDFVGEESFAPVWTFGVTTILVPLILSVWIPAFDCCFLVDGPGVGEPERVFDVPAVP